MMVERFLPLAVQYLQHPHGLDEAFNRVQQLLLNADASLAALPPKLPQQVEVRMATAHLTASLCSHVRRICLEVSARGQADAAEVAWRIEAASDWVLAEYHDRLRELGLDVAAAGVRMWRGGQQFGRPEAAPPRSFTQ